MAISALGMRLKLGDGTNNESFAAVAEVRSLSVSIEAETIEITHLDSNGWREFVSGLKTGEIEAELNFMPSHATHGSSSGLLKLLKEGAKRNFKLEWPPGSGVDDWPFRAIISKADLSFEPDGVVEASVTLQIDGGITL